MGVWLSWPLWLPLWHEGHVNKPVDGLRGVTRGVEREHVSLRWGYVPAQGLNEGGQGGTVPRAPNHCVGSRKLPTMLQVHSSIHYPTMLQVLSSIHYIHYFNTLRVHKTLGSNVGASNLLLVSGAIYLGTPLLPSENWAAIEERCCRIPF